MKSGNPGAQPQQLDPVGRVVDHVSLQRLGPTKSTSRLGKGFSLEGAVGWLWSEDGLRPSFLQTLKDRCVVPILASLALGGMPTTVTIREPKTAPMTEICRPALAGDYRKRSSGGQLINYERCEPERAMPPQLLRIYHSDSYCETVPFVVEGP